MRIYKLKDILIAILTLSLTCQKNKKTELGSISMTPDFRLEPAITADGEYNHVVKPSFLKVLAQIHFCLVFTAVAVFFCPPVGGDNLIQLDDDALKVMVTAEEQALGREFIRLTHKHLRLIEDPLLVNGVAGIGARLTKNLNVEPGIMGFHLVDNPAINGFAGPGGQIVLFTGLISTAETEAEFASVIAHELAHVTQRHLPRMIERARKRQIPATAGLIAGILLGGQAGAATMAATNAAALSDQLSYTRTFEREADAVGLRILRTAGYDPKAMGRFIQRMAQDTQFQVNEIPEYFRTHPLSLNRIAEIESRVVHHSQEAISQTQEYLLLRARALARYDIDTEHLMANFHSQAGADIPETASAGRYGLVLTGLRTGDHNQSVELALSLRAQSPENIFYVVGLAESLQAVGNLNDALKVLAEAMEIVPNQPVLTSYYADMLIKAGKPDQAKPAIRAGLRALPYSRRLFKLLARAEGELGRTAESFQALAEYHYLSGDLQTALAKLTTALKHVQASAYLTASITARRNEILLLSKPED